MNPDRLLAMVQQHMSAMGWTYFDRFGLVCKLTEELGELASCLNGTVLDADHTMLEIGDSLFALCCMANAHKIAWDSEILECPVDNKPVQQLFLELASSYGKLAKALGDIKGNSSLKDCLTECFCDIGAVAARLGYDPKDCLKRSIQKFSARDKDR
ncbi:MAG: hypothetical protein ABIF10_02390 [Candidatus Woesearchaeota archaeon]